MKIVGVLLKYMFYNTVEVTFLVLSMHLEETNLEHYLPEG